MAFSFFKSPLHPPPPPPRKIRRRNAPEAGFSITGVLVSSSIGLIVLTGTMQTLVNISHRLSVQEARLKQPLLHSYLIERFAKTGRCTKTLEGLKITENAAVTLDSGVKEYWANPTTAPRQHVASLKDAAGTVLRDLHSAQTQKDFKRDFDIDKFARLIFRGFHPEGDSGTPAVDFDDPGDTEEGRARLEAFVMDKGMFRKPIIVQLRGVKLKKDGHGTGIHKITACHSVDSVADHSAEIAALKARIKALEDLGLELDGGDLMSTKNFKTKSGHSIFTQGLGDIFTNGGHIYTTGRGGVGVRGTGSIGTTTGHIASGGDIYTNSYGSIYTARGSIYTKRAGDIYTRGTGRIYTFRGNIKSGGDIEGWNFRASVSVSTTGTAGIYTAGSGHIYTNGGHIYAGGNGWIWAGGSGSIRTSGGNIYTNGGGSIYTSGGHIYTGGSGWIWTSGSGSIRTSGGNIYTKSNGRIYTEGGNINTGGTGRIYTINGNISAGNSGSISTGGGDIFAGGNGRIWTSGPVHCCR